MFTIEKTKLHHAFQATLEDVIDYLKAYEAEHSDHHGSYLYEMTGCSEPEELITANPYAIKFLEQHPECIRTCALHMNPSEDALYLWRQLQLGKYEIQLGNTKTPNIDTYLQDVCVANLNFRTLSSNPHAFPFLRKHLDKVNWGTFSKNPEALDILEYYVDNISFYHLCCNTNPRAFAILRNNMDQIYWHLLCHNPCDDAIDLLEENPQFINYAELSENPNDRAIDLLLRQGGIDNVDWWAISHNPCSRAVQLLTEHVERIYWPYLCSLAQTKQQFELIRNNLDKVDWGSLCLNSNERVLPILIENQDKIQWWWALSKQPIFETETTYDYEGIRGARRELHEEYHAWAGHPSRLQQKWKDWGLWEDDEEGAGGE
jgi:hypothetical protein